MVNVTGMPTPKVTWYHGDDEVKATGNITIESSENSSTLTIKPVSAADAGSYKVVAKNKVGTASAEFTVNVKGRSFKLLSKHWSETIFCMFA